MKKILYVEDEESVVILVREILKDFELYAVKKVSDAIDLLKIKKFNLILLDLRLNENSPELEGEELLKFLKGKKQNIIILSAFADEAYKQAKKYKNVKGVIIKPFRATELREMVNKYI